MADTEITAPGLRWRKRAGDKRVPYWIAREDLVARGFQLRTARLHYDLTDPSAAALLVQRCHVLQDEMLRWANGDTTPIYIITWDDLAKAYVADPDSGFQDLRADSRKTYQQIIKTIVGAVGARELATTKGRDFKRWYTLFGEPVKAGGLRRVPLAHYCITMIRLLISFGVAILENEECRRLSPILKEMEFQGGRRREEELTADQAIAIRREAHRRNDHMIALAQAFQFDLMLRQKDVIGEWIPISEPGTSDIIAANKKWLFGIDWREVDDDLILIHRLSKSLKGRTAIVDPKQGKTKKFDLRKYPMVMEEIAHIPEDQRFGPIIKDPETGQPFKTDTFRTRWKKARKAAGIAANIQNRDNRAGAITEALDLTDGNVEAARNAAGHSRSETTLGYARNADRQTAKVADIRALRPKKDGT